MVRQSRGRAIKQTRACGRHQEEMFHRIARRIAQAPARVPTVALHCRRRRRTFRQTSFARTQRDRSRSQKGMTRNGQMCFRHDPVNNNACPAGSTCERRRLDTIVAAEAGKLAQAKLSAQTAAVVSTAAAAAPATGKGKGGDKRGKGKYGTHWKFLPDVDHAPGPGIASGRSLFWFSRPGRDSRHGGQRRESWKTSAGERRSVGSVSAGSCNDSCA